MKRAQKFIIIVIVVLVGAILVLSPHGEFINNTHYDDHHPNNKQNTLNSAKTAGQRRHQTKNYKTGHTSNRQYDSLPDEKLHQRHQHNTHQNEDLILDPIDNADYTKEAMALEDVVLPLGYPVHRQLPSKQEMIRGLEVQRSKQCNAQKLLEASPLLDLSKEKDTSKNKKKTKNRKKKATIDDKNFRQALEKQFDTKLNPHEPLFVRHNSNHNQEDQEEDQYWWIPFSKDSYHERRKPSLDMSHLSRLPCTEEVQKLLRLWQQPGTKLKSYAEEAQNLHDGGNDHNNDASGDNTAQPNPNNLKDDDTNNHDSCRSPKIKGLVSYLKSGAHGVGSAITLLAHDFLSALLINRRLVIREQKRNKKWFFAPSSEGCDYENAAETGWECLFLPATTCFNRRRNKMKSNIDDEKVHVVKSISSSGQQQWNQHRLISKSAFDIPGLSRNEYPSVERFFDTLLSALDHDDHHTHDNSEEKKRIRNKCVPLVKSWASEAAAGHGAERILMGTFKAASDPVLVYELAQVTGYLLRGVQPWFRQVIHAHLTRTMFGDDQNKKNKRKNLIQDDEEDEDSPLHKNVDINLDEEEAEKNKKKLQKSLVSPVSSSSPIRSRPIPSSLIFVHDRGELAKYREYYNSFGCHKFDQDGYLREVTDFLCPATKDRKYLRENKDNHDPDDVKPCTVFVSGNMPFAEYQLFRKRVEQREVRYKALQKHQPHIHNVNRQKKNVNDENNNIDDGDQQQHQQIQESHAADQNKNDHLSHRQNLALRRSSTKNDNNNNNELVPVFLQVQSTWNLTASSSQRTSSSSSVPQQQLSESTRWGASHPAAAWIDLFAGMHSTAWACVVQSNWCRVIDFVRMTLMKRMDCPFIDMGVASLSDGELRHRYCIVNEEWPKKPFSSVIARNLKLV